jgi:hypothetical protein
MTTSMSGSEYGGGWINLPNATATSTTTAQYPMSTWTVGTWPHQAAAAPQSMPAGWKCLDCGTVMAPWMQSHQCQVSTPVVTNTAGLADTQVLNKGGNGPEGTP